MKWLTSQSLKPTWTVVALQSGFRAYNLTRKTRYDCTDFFPGLLTGTTLQDIWLKSMDAPSLWETHIDKPSWCDLSTLPKLLLDFMGGLGLHLGGSWRLLQVHRGWKWLLLVLGQGSVQGVQPGWKR